MTVHAAPDYAICPKEIGPPGYPMSLDPDTFIAAPDSSTYIDRRQAYIQHCLNNPAPQNTKTVWHELVRMSGGAMPHEGIIQSALDFIDARRDCSDFVLHSILRLFYQFQEAGISPELEKVSSG